MPEVHDAGGLLFKPAPQEGVVNTGCATVLERFDVAGPLLGSVDVEDLAPSCAPAAAA